MASFPFSFWRLDPTFNGGGFGLNYGYQFDGTKSIDFGNVLDNDGTSAFSVSFWTRDIANSEWIITKQSARYEGLEINSDGNRKMGFSLGRTSTDRIACTSVDAIPLNQWNHWVMTYDGSKTVAGVEMYMNGVLQSKTTVRDTFVGSSSNSGTFNIGSLVWSVNNWLDCRLDDVQWYDFVLNSTQVSDIYNSGYVTAPTAAPIHHWKLGENDTWDGSNWDGVDEIGSLNGTSSNMVESDRKLGVAYSMNFDGVDEHIDFGNVNDLTGFEPFSISFWTTGYNGAGNRRVINKHDGSKGYYLYMNSSQNPGFIMQDGTNTIFVFSSLSSGVGHHVLTYDGSGLWTGIKYYINGVSNTVTLVTTNSSISSSISNTSNFYFGSPTNPINGDFMYLSMYNTELSASDVTTLYDNGVPTDPRDLGLSPTFFAPLGGPNDTYSGGTWTIVDEIGGNNGTSVNMEESDKTSDTP